MLENTPFACVRRSLIFMRVKTYSYEFKIPIPVPTYIIHIDLNLPFASNAPGPFGFHVLTT
jgi:hypothetical protein